MKKLGLLFVLAIAARLSADTIINPIDDGSIYGLAPSPNSVSRNAYVMSGGYIRGAVLFSSFNTSTNSAFVLTVNPYGLPIWDYTIDVYGYGSTSSTILATDYDKGFFLGTFNIPTNIGFGQDVLLDVTSFVKTTGTPYLGFIFRTEGTDVMSSLENNYGHPSSIVGAPDSAPSVVFLGMSSVFVASFLSKRRKSFALKSAA